MWPFLIEVGSLRIPSFGVMVTVAFLASMFVLRRELDRRLFPPTLADSLAFGAVVGGLIGAKLYYAIEAFSYFVENPFEVLISGSGFTFYGGLIGGAGGALAVTRINRLPVLPVLDAVALVLPLGYALGRLGCQLAGDGDYGGPTDLPWGMAYPDGVVPTLERVHPTPVYEMIQSLIIFSALMKRRLKSFPPGHLLCLCMILTGLARFWVEFVRINPPVIIGLSDAQIVSILIILAGSLGLFMIWRGKHDNLMA
jgi:phosphatidylglycerol:prolipoprotein diacylglycerol transferase